MESLHLSGIDNIGLSLHYTIQPKLTLEVHKILDATQASSVLRVSIATDWDSLASGKGTSDIKLAKKARLPGTTVLLPGTTAQPLALIKPTLGRGSISN